MQGKSRGLRLGSSSRKRGFTLIELVVGIAVIGTLAAIAIPRYIEVQNQARAAKLQQAVGAVSSGAKLFKAQCLVNGGSCATVAMEGVNVTGVNSYPTANTAGIVTAAGLSTSDYVVSGGGAAAGDTVTIAVSSPTASSCQFTYSAPAAANTAPTITVASTACN